MEGGSCFFESEEVERQDLFNLDVIHGHDEELVDGEERIGLRLNIEELKELLLNEFRRRSK